MGGKGSGKKPRAYPPEIVALATDLYLNGATVAEVQRELPAGYRAQTILERYLPERRQSIKRNQYGPKNHMWKGDDASYKALHLRVATIRGKPSRCSACDKTEGRFEWASMTGQHADPFDYVHRRIDAFRRQEIGTTLGAPTHREVMPNV